MKQSMVLHSTRIGKIKVEGFCLLLKEKRPPNFLFIKKMYYPIHNTFQKKKINKRQKYAKISEN